jgi:hypothetical protein
MAGEGLRVVGRSSGYRSSLHGSEYQARPLVRRPCRRLDSGANLRVLRRTLIEHIIAERYALSTEHLLTMAHVGHSAGAVLAGPAWRDAASGGVYVPDVRVGRRGGSEAMVKLAMKWSVGVIGVAVMAVGVVRVAEAASDAGNVALLIVGAVLLLSPFLIERIVGFSVTSTSFEVRLAREISDLGAPGTAKILQRTDLASFAQSYAYIREVLADTQFHDAQVYLQDLLVRRSAAISRREKFKAGEVRRIFRDGSPIMRILALGLMKGDRSLADSSTIISAIGDSRSRNEQYHGLELAEQCWYSLSKTEQQAIHLAISSSGIPAGSDRRPLADAVLAMPVS